MKPRYHINLFWSENDQCWVADVPDLKSCAAFGNSPQEALAEIEDAVSAWLESARAKEMPIPEAEYRPVIYAAE